MDYNINFRYKSGGGTQGSGLSTMMSARQRAIQASQKSAQTPGVLRPDESTRKLIDTNTKLTTAVLSLRQSVTMLNATIKSRGGFGGGGIGAPGGGGGGVTPTGVGGFSGLGAVGTSIGMLGIPVAIAGFAAQKISQIGNAYIEKVAQQRGTVGIGGFRQQRIGAYMGPEVASAVKAHRMAAGTFAGEVDPMAYKFGTVFGQGAEQIGQESGAIARYGGRYSDIVRTGMGSGIETDMPRFVSAIASEMEDAVKRGVNASDLASDMSGELAKLTSHTSTKSVEMAMGIISKTRAAKESAARGQISGYDSLMMWKAGQEKLVEQFNAPDSAKFIENLQRQGMISPEAAQKLMGGGQTLESIRQTIGQGGLSYLSKYTTETMGEAEAARRAMMQSQRVWGSDIEGMYRFEAMHPQFGSNMNVQQRRALWQAAGDPVEFEKQFREDQKMDKMFGKTEGSDPMLGLKRAQRLDNLLYEHGRTFAKVSEQMEKSLIKVVDTLADKVVPALENLAGGKSSGGKKPPSRREEREGSTSVKSFFGMD